RRTSRRNSPTCLRVHSDEPLIWRRSYCRNRLTRIRPIHPCVAMWHSDVKKVPVRLQSRTPSTSAVSRIWHAPCNSNVALRQFPPSGLLGLSLAIFSKHPTNREVLLKRFYSTSTLIMIFF